MTYSELDFMTILQMHDAITKKEISPVEIVNRAIVRQEETEDSLNAFVTTTPELALEAARRSEKRAVKGKLIGRLDGIPVSIKDLMPVNKIRWTSGSKVLKDNYADEDAVIASRLTSLGGCIIGKTTTSEFGCKAVGDSPLTGLTRNPWDLTKTPGGSSCGAAASVAAGITPVAIGTDGGGSIRIPASFTGLFGIKPTFGRIPFYPVAATPTLAHTGPLTRTVRDSALLLQECSGFDRRDSFSIAGKVKNYLMECDLPCDGLRVAWSPTLGYAKPTQEIVNITEKSLQIMEKLGCNVEIVTNVMNDPIDMWMAEFYAGVGTKLKNVVLETPEILDPAIVKILSNALDQSIEEYYVKLFQRYDLRYKMFKFFNEYDILITPTLPVEPFDVGLDVPPMLTERNIVSWSYYTYPFNLTGQPAASLPAGVTNTGLPVGLQLVSKLQGECNIFRLASAYEKFVLSDGRYIANKSNCIL